MTRPSPAMLAAMRNLAAGKRPNAGLSGRSAHGGLSGTMVALRRRGWINAEERLTDAGRAALAQAQPPQERIP